MREIKFSTTIPGGDRRHYLTEEDVIEVLSRLPEEIRQRLPEELRIKITGT